MKEFLASTEIIDWQHPMVLARARQIAAGAAGPLEIARRCFEWNRDHIQHSRDFQRDEVTCSASQVLAAGTGWCYAKSHLLAALLRANGIPAGLGYQRLSMNDDGPPYCLHGLTAIYLPGFGWYRVDSRGNKPGVDAQFTPPAEQLAWEGTLPGERNFAEILSEPLPLIVTTLRKCRTWREVYSNLPDWDEPSLPAPAPLIDTLAALALIDTRPA